MVPGLVLQGLLGLRTARLEVEVEKKDARCKKVVVCEPLSIALSEVLAVRLRHFLDRIAWMDYNA